MIPQFAARACRVHFRAISLRVSLHNILLVHNPYLQSTTKKNTSPSPPISSLLPPLTIVCLITLAKKTYLQVFLNFTHNSSAACTTYPMNKIYLLSQVDFSISAFIFQYGNYLEHLLSPLSCSQSLQTQSNDFFVLGCSQKWNCSAISRIFTHMYVTRYLAVPRIPLLTREGGTYFFSLYVSILL